MTSRRMMKGGEALLMLQILACSGGCSFNLFPDRKPPTCPPRYSALPSNIVLPDGIRAEIHAMNGYTPTTALDEAEIESFNPQTKERQSIIRVELTTWNELVGKLEVLKNGCLRYTNSYSILVDASRSDRRVEQTADGNLCISGEGFSFTPQGSGSIDHSAFLNDELKNTGSTPLAVKVAWYPTKPCELFPFAFVRDTSQQGVTWTVDLQPGGDLLVAWAWAYTLQRARAKYTNLDVTADDWPLVVLRKSEYDGLNPLPTGTNFAVLDKGEITLHRFVGSPTVNSLSPELHVSVVEGR